MIDKKLLAYFEGYLTDKRKSLFKKVLEERTRHFAVVLEDIFQPHNASAVIRTADIFGVQDVHAIENKYTITVDELPVEVGIDPYNKLIDRNSEDNRRKF